MGSAIERSGTGKWSAIVSAPAALAERLPRIRWLSTEVRSQSASGWSGHGQGEVVVGQVDDGSIRYTETGAFELEATGVRMPFRNVLRWTVLPDRIVLAHCRQYAEAGTRLVEFRAAPESSGTPELRAAAPHHCGGDCYDAVVRLVEDGFDLHWRITGPRKDEALVHRYRMVADNGCFERNGNPDGTTDRS